MTGGVKRSGFFRTLVTNALQSMQRGCLLLELPDGGTLRFGTGDEAHAVRIRVCREDFFRKCVLYGEIGLGESYVDGDWETGDIEAVLAWMLLNIENNPALVDQRPKAGLVNFLKFFNNLSHVLKRNSLDQSRRNIEAHYDLGNDFFRIFLDPSLTYSSAYFKSAHETLEDAQKNKIDRLCRKLGLKAGDRVLEIGSGWGGFAFYAAEKFGCEVTTLTLSREQHGYVRERARTLGLDRQVDAQLLDYRRATGSYDKIVSIEMIEAVGHHYLDAYFRQCHRLLKKDGVLGLQAILCPDGRYEHFRDNSDWIKKHIFPGGFLPSFEAILSSVRRTGDLCLHDYKDMSPSYVRTLAHWREGLLAGREKVRALGFDDRFMRKWNYYFSYCEAAFRMRNIAVAQLVFSRANNPNLPQAVR